MRLGKPYRRTGRQQRGASAIFKFEGMKEKNGAANRDTVSAD
jgi:hypothetical protein